MRKVYEITLKGKETLKIILKEYLKLRESLNSLISYTIGTDDEFSPIFFQMMGVLDSFFKKNPLENYREKSKEEKLKLLEFHYSLICQKIKDFMNLKQKYGKSLLKLKKKLQMKKFEEKSESL